MREQAVNKIISQAGFRQGDTCDSRLHWRRGWAAPVTVLSCTQSPGKIGLLLVQLLHARFLSSRAAKLSFTLLLGSLEPDVTLLAFTHPPSTHRATPFQVFSLNLLPATRHSVCRVKKMEKLKGWPKIRGGVSGSAGLLHQRGERKVFPFCRRTAAPAWGQVQPPKH